MATFKRERQNLVTNGKVGDVDVMVTNTMKKLALQKEKTTTTSSGQPHEIMRPKASIYDIQRKFSSIEENQTNSSKSSSILQSPTTTSSLSMEIEFRSHQQLGTTVDDMVNNTLKKLEKKKSLVETPTDDNHDKEGNILRSKTSVAEFRNRFSDSSERGKEGYNSLETTPIGKAYKYSDQESTPDIILEERTGPIISNRNEIVNDLNKQTYAGRQNLSLNLSGAHDARIRVNRKPSHPISQPISLITPNDSPTTTPSKIKAYSPSVEIANYDKERESTLKKIKHGELLRQSPVRDQLESIVQTKVNSITIENVASKSSSATDIVAIPTPAPRKISPKNHHAPPVPTAQESKSLKNNYKEQDPETNDGIMKVKKNNKSAAPKPPQTENRMLPKKEKINIKTSDIESSGTNYSNLEWRK